MTDTAARLRRLGLPHARARAGAILVSSAGVGSPQATQPAPRLGHFVPLTA